MKIRRPILFALAITQRQVIQRLIQIAKQSVLYGVIACLLSACSSISAEKKWVDKLTVNTIPSPLFIDPNYNGSSDPEIIWNAAKNKWFIYYTARRATLSQGSYVGTPIGVISSTNLRTWQFEGYANFTDSVDLVHQGKPDMQVTFWAPGVVQKADELHMFVTYKNNANPPWGGGPGEIRHYVTQLDEPVTGWTLVKSPNFIQPDPIDATIFFDKNQQQFTAYYRVADHKGINMSVSEDLINWQNLGPVKGDINHLGKQKFGYQEAPYIFKFKDSLWMLTDPHKGLVVYRSQDGVNWQYNNTLLIEGTNRLMDSTMARHPSVAVGHEKAFLVYHVEPNRIYGKNSPKAPQRTAEQKKSVLQMIELKVENGLLVSQL